MDKYNSKSIIEGKIYKFGNRIIFQQAGKPYICIDNVSIIDLLKIKFSTHKQIKIKITIEEE